MAVGNNLKSLPSNYLKDPNRTDIHMWFLQIAKPRFYDSHIPSVRKCRMENGWVKIIDYWPAAMFHTISSTHYHLES